MDETSIHLRNIRADLLIHERKIRSNKQTLALECDDNGARFPISNCKLSPPEEIISKCASSLFRNRGSCALMGFSCLQDAFWLSWRTTGRILSTRSLAIMHNERGEDCEGQGRSDEKDKAK